MDIDMTPQVRRAPSRNDHTSQRYFAQLQACQLVSTTATAHGQWAQDLVALGYTDPIPALSLAVQATLASLKAPEIHAFIQEQDQAAILDCDEEGDHAPLLVSTLDLSQWTLILNLTIRDSIEKALGQLRIAHSQLVDILDWEAEELVQAEKDAVVVEAALKNANPHEASKCFTSTTGSSSSSSSSIVIIIIIFTSTTGSSS